MSFRKIALLFILLTPLGARELPELPAGAALAMEEDWSEGLVEERWYAMRRHWGRGNHGVVPENVRVAAGKDADGSPRKVLVCRAQGDRYEGPITGLWNRGDRVGGVVVSKEFFASGRFEVEMRVGGREPVEGGPEDPTRPIGAVPAIWTYAGKSIRVPEERADGYVDSKPLYQPALQQWGRGNAFYWSEIDFPELGKEGDFDHGLYNTYLNKQADYQVFPVGVADGRFHTYVTEWRTMLEELDGVGDDQVAEHAGFWWVRDLDVPIDGYWGCPLEKLGPDRYAVCVGRVARHWIDGEFVGENTEHVPSIAAQLTLGVWLPGWGGPAPWKTAEATFGDVRIWQYHDDGDVRGLLTNDQPDNMGPHGRPLKSGT